MEIENDAVSIIEYVDNPEYAKNVFQNYILQDVGKKELILVYSGISDDFEKWLYLTKMYPMTRIYRQRPGTPRGECLNYCAERSIFENIAVFGESDLYESNYISSALKDMQANKVQLVGKRTYYKSDDKENANVLADPGFEGRITDFVILPTFVLKRTLFDVLKFESINEGIDIEYCGRCRERGYDVYSGKADGFTFLNT